MVRRGFLLALLARPSFPDADSNPVVVVIGTLHNATALFTGRDLWRALEAVRPAAILVEAESPSRGFGSVEGLAVKAYLSRRHADVVPYDIQGRDRIMQTLGYRQLEREFVQVVGRMHGADELNPEARALWDEVLSDFRSRDAFRGRMDQFNSPACDQVVERKNGRMFRSFQRIARMSPKLARFREFADFYADFWVLRNRAMVRNILRVARDFAGARLAVLCGFEHRYYLIRELKKSPAISVREYRDFWSG
jgi:hypothetical protein